MSEQRLWVQGALHWTTDDEGRGWWEIFVTDGGEPAAGLLGQMVPVDNFFAGHDGAVIRIVSQNEK
jgi:hypothetical protein